MPRKRVDPDDQETAAFWAHCGACIRDWRDENELTQDAVGHILGVTSKTLARWEAGGAMPRVDDLARMERLHPGLVARVFAKDALSPGRA